MKAFVLWIPTHHQSSAKRLPRDAPFDFEFGALLVGQFRGDRLKVTILARFDPLPIFAIGVDERSEEHTSELQSRQYLVCRLLLEKKNYLSNLSVSYFARLHSFSSFIHLQPTQAVHLSFPLISSPLLPTFLATLLLISLFIVL